MKRKINLKNGLNTNAAASDARDANSVAMP